MKMFALGQMLGIVAADGATSTGTSVLDSSIVTFVVDAVKQFLGILTTPPLGVFLTIGILGAVVGLVGVIVSMVKH